MDLPQVLLPLLLALLWLLTPPNPPCLSAHPQGSVANLSCYIFFK